MSLRRFAFLLSLFGTFVPCVSPGSPFWGTSGPKERSPPPRPGREGQVSLRPPLAAPEPASPQLSRRGRHCRVAVPEEGGGERWRVPAPGPALPTLGRGGRSPFPTRGCEGGGSLPSPALAENPQRGFQYPLPPPTRRLYQPGQPTQEACHSGTV